MSFFFYPILVSQSRLGRLYGRKLERFAAWCGKRCFKCTQLFCYGHSQLALSHVQQRWNFQYSDILTTLVSQITVAKMYNQKCTSKLSTISLLDWAHKHGWNSLTNLATGILRASVDCEMVTVLSKYMADQQCAGPSAWILLALSSQTSGKTDSHCRRQLG